MNRVIAVLVAAGAANVAAGQITTIDFESFAVGDTGLATGSGSPSSFHFNGEAIVIADSYFRSIPLPPFSEPVYQTVVDTGLTGPISGKAVSGDLSGRRILYSVDFSLGSTGGPLFPEFYVGTFGIGSTLSTPLEIEVVRFGQMGSILSRDRYMIPAGSAAAPGVLEVDFSALGATTGVSINNINDVQDFDAVTFFDSFVYGPNPIPGAASAPMLALGGLLVARRRRGVTS